MVGIFQLILLVLKGIQFPKKKREGHQVNNTCGSFHKNFSFLSSWMVREETVTKRHAVSRSKATLQLGIVFDGQNFEMQKISQLYT